MTPSFPCPHCRKPIDFRRIPERDREAILRAASVQKMHTPRGPIGRWETRVEEDGTERQVYVLDLGADGGL